MVEVSRTSAIKPGVVLLTNRKRFVTIVAHMPTTIHSSDSASHNSRKAFTIVELLIVIAVIGILVTIPVVSYIGTQKRAEKGSYDAIAQQVKMKLGEHLTDKGHYPRVKTEVSTYLSDSGSGSTLTTEFTKPGYQYRAYTNPAKTTQCTTSTPTTSCQYYEITISKAQWRGDTADTDLVIRP